MIILLEMATRVLIMKKEKERAPLINRRKNEWNDEAESSVTHRKKEGFMKAN